MHVDIQTTSVKPIRQTFSFIARRLGADKPASRYQEATIDMQPEVNFHYRPLWEPERALYDKARTAIVMQDWYSFKDPRHFYYGGYVMARAKQQDATDRQYEFVEKRQLLTQLDAATRQRIQFALVPLRHYEWGANMNNCFITAYGWGAAITQATQFATMDRLGIAQYLTRVGLMLDANGEAALDQAKEDWLHALAWQGVRRLMENLFVTKDWFEVFVAQNLVFDGLLYPLVYRHLEADLNPGTGNALSMLTGFMNDWYDETTRWVDATVKTAAEESPANAQQLTAWTATWRAEILRALAPLASAALGADAGATALAQADAALGARIAKLGLRA